MNNTSQHPWSNIYRTSRNKERHFALSMIVVLTCGAVFDVFEINWIVVQDIAAVSLTSLQIQATLVGLSLAIISMISSLSTESHYGISLCDYYMSRKAVIFPQKRIVIAAIVLVGLGMVFHLFAWYNLVLCLLWVSCGLVILSFTMLFSALSGTESAKEEIWQYMDYMLCSSDVTFEKKADLFNRYVNAWSPATENEVVYDKENDLFLRAMNSLLEQDDENALPVIQSAGSDLIKRIVYDCKVEMQLRAIGLLYNVYREIYEHIEANNYKHISRYFKMFDDCMRVLDQCYKQIQIQDFRLLPNWRTIADAIDRVNIYCHAEEETDESSLARASMFTSFFPKQMGAIIGSRAMETSESLITRNSYSFFAFQKAEHIPESAKKTYCVQKCQYEFLYYRALLENSAVEAATSLFHYPYRWSAQISSLDIYFVFLVLIYTWYLAEKESGECVTEVQKSSAKQALGILQAKEIVKSVFDQIRWKGDKVNFDDLPELLHSFLSHQEHFSLGNSKWPLMDGIVDDFLFFTATITCGYREDHPFASAILKRHNICLWYSHYFIVNQEKTTAILQEIQQTFFPSIQNDVILKNGLENLSRQAYRVCKDLILQEAEKNAKEYGVKNHKNALFSDFSKKITDDLRNETRKWLKETTDQAKEQVVELDRTGPISIEFLNYSSVEDIFPLSGVYSRFFEFVESILLKNDAITAFSRNIESDDAYLNLLTNNQAASLVGSSFALGVFDFNRMKEYQSLTSQMSRISVESWSKDLLLTRNDIGIEILDGWISTEPVTLDDISCSFDEKTGLYTYSPIAEVPIHFTREELEEYLKNSMIQLVYSVRLRLDIPDGDCGYLIEVG